VIPVNNQVRTVKVRGAQNHKNHIPSHISQYLVSLLQYFLFCKNLVSKIQVLGAMAFCMILILDFELLIN